MQSSQAEITQKNQQKYLISGVVDFSTVPDLQRQSSAFLKAIKTSDDQSTNSRRVAIDLSQVEKSNSAALALMLEMVKSARQNNIELHFENIPVTVLTIAKAYGVENEIRELCK